MTQETRHSQSRFKYDFLHGATTLRQMTCRRSAQQDSHLVSWRDLIDKALANVLRVILYGVSNMFNRLCDTRLKVM